MADYLVLPPARRALGILDAPSSKSATNRALVLAAMSSDPVEIGRPLESEDTAALARCLAAMGARIERRIDALIIQGPLAGPPGEEVTLDAGESGTAARFLAALGAATPGRFLLTGSPRLRGRPMRELLEALVSLGASVESREREGFLPVAILGRRLRGTVCIDASRSSQFLSALLLAGAATEEGLQVEAAGEVASAPYVAMTIQALRAFGHSVSEGPRLRVARGQRTVARYEIPGDYSSALPLFAAAGVVGGHVVVRRLAWPAPDADAQALPALEAMGLSMEAESGAVSVSRDPKGHLKALRVRATDFPDAVPVLAALAVFASGESRFEGIGHLRFKESDRIEALVRLLSCAGAWAEAAGEALVVRGPIEKEPGSVRSLPTANDHRIVMAAALLSLRLPGLLLENPDCVAKSYPAFFRDLETIVER